MPGLSWLTARPIAHRGLHDVAAGVIENTATAVRHAIAANYGIEVDLQITADGEAVVYHDDRLGRLTDGSAPLSEMTAAALQRVAFRDTSDRILRLGELCDLVAGRVTLLLELKSRFVGDLRLPRRVAAVLQSYAGPVAAMSFDPTLVCALRDAAPFLPRGIVAQTWRRRRPVEETVLPRAALAYLPEVVRMQPHFVAYAVTDLPAALPLFARHVLGMPLLAWTVRSAAERLRAARWADQIIFEGFRP